MVVRSVNPTSGQEIEQFEEFTAKEIDAHLARADDAFHRWRRTPFAERGERMHAVAEVFRRRKRAYGETM
ncbi:MAG: aldehyde dehydrogenase family protein, partial [Candidatus Thermoplasmatota archaeon]